MSEPSGILVLGAAELGEPMLRSLATHPSRSQSSISVLLRLSTADSEDPVKKVLVSRIKDMGIHVVTGDILNDSIQDLAETFKIYHTVISCLGFSLPPGSLVKLAKAVLEAQVPVFFPWQFGADYDAIGFGSPQDRFDEQLEVRDLLRQQGKTHWVIISTGIFISMITLAAFGAVDVPNRRLRSIGSWDNEATVTAPDDIARMTAEIVFDPEVETFYNKVTFIAGDTVSFRRLADLVEARFPGERFVREEWTKEKLDADLKEDPDNMIKKYRAVTALGIGIAWSLEGTLNYERGIKLKNVEAYLKEDFRA